MKKKKTRMDLLLILVLLGAALIGGTVFMLNRKEGKKVSIRQGSGVICEFPLNKDLEYDITGEDGAVNHLVIKDGYACISEASCPDKVCVLSGAIQETGQLLVCLPNQVLVEIIE